MEEEEEDFSEERKTSPGLSSDDSVNELYEDIVYGRDSNNDIANEGNISAYLRPSRNTKTTFEINLENEPVKSKKAIVPELRLKKDPVSKKNKENVQFEQGRVGMKMHTCRAAGYRPNQKGDFLTFRNNLGKREEKKDNYNERNKEYVEESFKEM